MFYAFLGCSTTARLLHNQGAVAGVFAAIGLVAAAIIALLVLFARRRRRLNRRKRRLPGMQQQRPDFFAGHFYFTKLLIPALLAGAKSSPDGKARVVNTSSSASLLTSGVDFNTLRDTAARKKCTPSTLYAQSKLVGVSTFIQTV